MERVKAIVKGVGGFDSVDLGEVGHILTNIAPYLTKGPSWGIILTAERKEKMMKVGSALIRQGQRLNSTPTLIPPPELVEAVELFRKTIKKETSNGRRKGIRRDRGGRFSVKNVGV